MSSDRGRRQVALSSRYKLPVAIPPEHVPSFPRPSSLDAAALYSTHSLFSAHRPPQNARSDSRRHGRRRPALLRPQSVFLLSFLHDNEHPKLTWHTFFCLPAAFAADCSRTYTVVDGDICDSISAANNASTYQLAAINSGTIDSTCGNLAAGNSICLGTSGEDCQATYVVQDNDTCEGIMGVYGINSTMLMTNNPNIEADCSNIYVGEVSCSCLCFLW